MKKTYLFAILALLIAGLACSSESNQKDTTEATPELDDGIYFQDDFSDESASWPTIREESGVTDFEDGVYRIYVNEPNADYLGAPGVFLERDIRVEVDATKVGGPDENDFGVLCRRRDEDNYYQFMITSDGYVGIMKRIDGSQYSIANEKLVQHFAINKGDAQNHIRADCIGDTLTLYVNDQQVASAQDTTFMEGGDIGLFAGTYDLPGADIHFDNLIVTMP